MNGVAAASWRTLPGWTRQWAGDSGVLLGGQVFAVLSSTIIAIVVARELSPADWALFAAVFALGSGLSILVDFGLATWLLRELTRVPDLAAARVATLVTGAALVTGSIGLLICAGAVATGLAVGLDGRTVAVVAGLLLYTAAVAVAAALEAYLRARRKVGRVLAGNVLDRATLLVLVVALAFAGAGLVPIAAVFPAAALARLAFAAFSVFVRCRVAFTPPDARLSRSLLRRGSPFLLTTVSLNLFPRLDAFVLLLLSVTSAAYYGIAERFLVPALIVPTVLGMTLFPFVGGTGSRRSTLAVTAVTAGLGVAATAIGIVAAPFLVPALFGGKYADAVPVVQVLLGALPFVYASAPLMTYLYSRGRERAVLIATLGSSLAGTGALVAGQVLAGARLAAAGPVFRQVLFLTAFAILFAALRVPSDADTAAPSVSETVVPPS